MQVSINGPEIDDCGSLIEAAVKKWLPKRKKLYLIFHFLRKVKYLSYLNLKVTI